MTLKSFHVVFISCSSALSFLFGVWILGNPEFTGAPRLIAAIAAFAVGLGLIGYESWFLRYSRRHQ
ncbi:MAG: hypothetical protein ABI609_04245 [Acidobacteriota bacterium]